MAAASATRRTSGPVLRSLSPSGRFSTSSSSAFASSTTSTFSSPSRTFVSSSPSHHHYHNRHSSPTRVSLPSRRENVVLPSSKTQPPHQKKSCMCSPTNHPGSFRCSLHKAMGLNNNGMSARQQHGGQQNRDVGPYQSNRLHARRSAMTNSLVRIGTVEGDLVKRALAALIRPSSHSQRRRQDFQPRKSRLSIMSSTGSC